MVVVSENHYIYIFEYLLSHPCVDCNEADPIVLQFDHITNNKSHDIATMANSGYSWSALQEEINKCAVRCANCHLRKTAQRANSYRYQQLNLVAPRGIEPPSLVS